MDHGAPEKNSLSNPDRWVDLYGDYLYRFALSRLRDSHQAENVVQETFCAALEARKAFFGRSSERTWLTGILKHKIIDSFRQRYRESPVTDLEANDEAVNSFFDIAGHPKQYPSDWYPEPYQMLENKEFWAIFRSCLEKLPRATRDCFILREMENTSSKEICRILNISPSNFWVMMHRARLQLSHCLETNWEMPGHPDVRKPWNWRRIKGKDKK